MQPGLNIHWGWGAACQYCLHTWRHALWQALCPLLLLCSFLSKSRDSPQWIVLGKMHIESFASRIFGLLTARIVDESCELCIEYEYALVRELSCTVSQLGVGGKEWTSEPPWWLMADNLVGKIIVCDWFVVPHWLHSAAAPVDSFDWLSPATNQSPVTSPASITK